VYLLLQDFDCDPDEITRIIGLNPTIAVRKGESRPGLTTPCKASIWQLDAPYSDDESDVEVHADALLDLLEPHLHRFRDLPHINYIMVCCTVYARAYMPAIGFSAKTVRRIAEIGALIDVDVSCSSIDNHDSVSSLPEKTING
jgi:hypothetical protein